MTTLVRTRTGDRRVDGDSIIDALTIVTVSILVLSSVSITDIVADTTISASTRLVWAAYPSPTRCCSRWSSAPCSPPAHARPSVCLALGVACWLGSDLGYLVLPVEGVVSALLDVGWMVGGLLMASAAFRRPAAAEPAPSEDDEPGRDQVGVSASPSSRCWSSRTQAPQRRPGRRRQPGLLAVGTALLLALALVRTSRLLGPSGEHERSSVRTDASTSTLTDNSSDAVLVVDVEGAVIRHSPHLARLVGLSAVPEDLHWTELVEHADHAVLDELFRDVLSGHRRPVTAEVRVLAASGPERWMSARMVDLSHDPDVRGVAVFASADITARKPRRGRARELARTRRSRARAAEVGVPRHHEPRDPHAR